jgi:hypothetical protein
MHSIAGGVPMNRKMTIDEIEREFQSEWILIDDPRTDAANRVQEGTVICHSRNRDEVYREAARLKLKRFALHFTGRPVPGMKIIV